MGEKEFTACIGKIEETINLMGGLSEEGLVPRKFFSQGGTTVQQLSLFERPTSEYEAGEAEAFELD